MANEVRAEMTDNLTPKQRDNAQRVRWRLLGHEPVEDPNSEGYWRASVWSENIKVANCCHCTALLYLPFVPSGLGWFDQKSVKWSERQCPRKK
jgi:hypothetical protein